MSPWPLAIDTIFASFCVFIAGMERRMPLDSGGQERGHVYPVQCEYLKLLIEQTPRDQCALRERLKDRLGLHF